MSTVRRPVGGEEIAVTEPARRRGGQSRAATEQLLVDAAVDQVTVD